MVAPSESLKSSYHRALVRVVVAFLAWIVGTVVESSYAAFVGPLSVGTMAPGTMNRGTSRQIRQKSPGGTIHCDYCPNVRPAGDECGNSLVLDGPGTDQPVGVKQEQTEGQQEKVRSAEASIAKTTLEQPFLGKNPTSVGCRISRVLIGHRCPLTERLYGFFLVARDLLESPVLASDSVGRLCCATGLDGQARRRIEWHVVGADHLGTLIPPGVDADAVLALAACAGFNQRILRCPSAIVARELGTKCGRETVSTELLKASGILSNGRRGGVEVFLPDVEPDLAEHWIGEARDYHLALRVSTRGGVHAIHAELKAAGYPIPAFMNGRPMENRVERVLMIYVDLPDGRIEFIHYEEEANGVAPSTSPRP